MKTKVLTRAAVLLAAFCFAGCGGCGPEEEPAAKQPAAKQPAPAEQPQKEDAKPAAKAPAPAAEEEPDCFVIVDAEPDYGPPPLKVQFMTEIDCTAEPVTYTWDFGDGTKGGNEPNPVHVYEKPGDFVATVITKSPDGGEGDDEIDVTVDPDLAE